VLLLLHSSAVGLLVTVLQQIRCRHCHAVRRLLLLLLQQALSSQISTLWIMQMARALRMSLRSSSSSSIQALHRWIGSSGSVTVSVIVTGTAAVTAGSSSSSSQTEAGRQTGHLAVVLLLPLHMAAATVRCSSSSSMRRVAGVARTAMISTYSRGMVHPSVKMARPLALAHLTVRLVVLQQQQLEGGVQQQVLQQQQQQQQGLGTQQVCDGGKWDLRECSRSGSMEAVLLLLLLGVQVGVVILAAAAAAAGGTQDPVAMVQQQITVAVSMALAAVVTDMERDLQVITTMLRMVAAAAGTAGLVETEMTGVITTVMTEVLAAGRRLDLRVSRQARGVCSSSSVSGNGEEGLVLLWGLTAAVSSSSIMAGRVTSHMVAAGVAATATLLLLLAVQAVVMRRVLRILGQQEGRAVVVMGESGAVLQAWVRGVLAVQQQAVLLLLLLLLLTVNFALL
jgi:hypothetical protein